MKRFFLSLTLLSLTLVGCSAVVANSAPQPTQEEKSVSVDLSRTDEQGTVSVIVKPLNLENPDLTLDFDVTLDTHSVELDMDLVPLALLTTDTGLTIPAKTWTAPSGGHHVSGTLSFPATVNGTAVLNGVNKLTLTLQNVDVPERRFEWEL
jgi:hypothetical protein